MFFSRNKVQESVDSLRGQGSAVAQSAGKVLSHSVAHVATLADLLCVEVEESWNRLEIKAKVLFVGLCLFLCGYGVLVALVCLLLSRPLGWEWTLGIVSAFHLVLGTIVIIISTHCKVGPYAPATLQELKNDVQCIQILLQEENGKS